MEYNTTATPYIGEQTPNNDTKAVVDNRPRLEVDPKQVETWELMLMEDRTARFQDLVFLFCRYLVNGKGRVSPELPYKPFDEMTQEDVGAFKASDAFKILRRYKLQQLRGAAQSFAEQASTALDPN